MRDIPAVHVPCSDSYQHTLIHFNWMKMTKLWKLFVFKARMTEKGILNEHLKNVKIEDIKCIQLTVSEGQNTLFDENTRNRLALKL